MEEIRSNIPHSEVPKVAKWSIRNVRGGVTGDVMFVFSLLDVTGNVLQKFDVTREVGMKFDALRPGALISKIFSCGTKKSIEKQDA